jgi:hypothetical protein
MDGERFDNLSRALASGALRRDLLRGLAAGVAAGLAANVVGRPLPDAKAADPSCDIIEVFKCIRNANRIIQNSTRTCFQECSPGKRPLFPGCLHCFERARIRQALEAVSCRSNPCGATTWCVLDVERLAGVCCPPGDYTMEGVCKKCAITCDPAKGMVPEEDVCDCKCDLSFKCPGGSYLDPVECRCLCEDTFDTCDNCITTQCSRGQDERTCKCNCVAPRDCPNSPCAECINGLCEPCPETHYCCTDGDVPRGCCRKKETHCCPKDFLSVCRAKDLPCVSS